jgi:hypothetical protein
MISFNLRIMISSLLISRFQRLYVYMSNKKVLNKVAATLPVDYKKLCQKISKMNYSFYRCFPLFREFFTVYVSTVTLKTRDQ